MARYRKRNAHSELIDLVLRAIFLLALLGYAPVIGWWRSLSEMTRFLLVMLLTILIFSLLGLIILWQEYRKRQRALAWQKAMFNWQNNSNGKSAPQQQSARYLSDRELEEFAKQVYAKMGYQVKHTGKTGDHGVDVRLVNPKQEVELVQCKQWRKRVGEPTVRDLYGAMMHEGAVRGWIWAPSGFSKPAQKWAKGKPIVLADDEEIGHLVESAYQA